MAPLYEKFDYKSLAIEPATRGSRLAPIYSINRRVMPVFQLSPAPTLSTPFGASAFEEGQTRLSLILHVPEALAAWFDEVDSHFIMQVAKSGELLKRPMTEEEIRAAWKPAITRREGYPDQLRCKYNLTGNRAVRCWTAEGAPVQLAATRDLRNHPCTAQVKPTGFWNLAGKEMGISWDVVSMLLGPSLDACPFEMVDEETT